MILLPDKHNCRASEKTYNIILGQGKYIVSVPHQTFGRHVNTIAEDVAQKVDRLAFNSINGEIFIADNQVKKIMTVDTKNNNVFDTIDDHIMSVISLDFGESKE